METKVCAVDCVSEFTEWSVCDPSTGEQSRGVVITTPDFGGGAVCKQESKRPCKVDCVVEWNAWSPCDEQTGRRTRDFVVKVAPLNGHDGEGKKCPPIDEEDCPIDCKGRWSDWTVCESPTGNYPPFTKSRGWIVTVPALNGGKECNAAETEPCLPEAVSYTHLTLPTKA